MTRDGNDEDHADPNELVRKRKGGQRHDQPKKDCSRPENEDKPHCALKDKPRYYSKDSPSRKNVPLAPLGYIQFYLPALDLQSVDAPAWEVEYTTHKAQHFIPHTATQPMPVPLHLLPGFDAGLFRDEGDDIDEEITTRREKFRAEMKRITPWGMKDLTIGSYVKLARQLVAERKMWNKFSEIMSVACSPYGMGSSARRSG